MQKEALRTLSLSTVDVYCYSRSRLIGGGLNFRKINESMSPK